MNEFKKSSNWIMSVMISGAGFGRSPKTGGKGHRILKLNIGNPRLRADRPGGGHRAVAANLQGRRVLRSKGLYPAREAIKIRHEKGIRGVAVDDIYIGNGVSELIVQAMRAFGQWRRI